MAENNKILSLIVGCGGSGVTTMIALNRLFAENPEMRYRIHREIFYIAVDTETAMLSKFNTEVQKQMGGAKMPLIESILLSKDINVLNSVIKPYFEDPFARGAGDGNGLDRLKANWWFDEKGKPFRAPLVSNLLLGAGQCPPASYCLAWSKMNMIETAIKNIITAIKRRGHGDPDVLNHLNVFVVAGLSGGTGRGSWNLITFKIRQCFAAEGVSIDPVGVFFDANVFENVQKTKGKEQARAIRVNALTGLSELSCWLSAGRAQEKDDKFVYKLPSMKKPGDEKTDVLDTTVGISPTSGAPVNSAYLICGPSKSTTLADNAQYHEMAGAGLYAMIANSDLSGERVNNSNPYNSFAATTFEIDAVHLQGYFEAIAQGVALEGLKGCDDNVSDRLKEFLAEVPMVVEVHEKEDILPPSGGGGTLLQMVGAELLAHCEGSLKSLAEDLPTLKPNEAEEEAESRVEQILSSVSDRVIDSAVKKVLENTLNGINPVVKVKEAVLKIYKGGRKERPSVGRVRKFMAELLNKVLAARDGSVEGFGFDDPTGASAGQVGPRDWILGKVREFSKRTTLEKLSAGKPFNPREIKELVSKSNRIYSGAVAESILFVHYGKIREKIQAFFKPTEEYVANLVDACDRFAKLCDRAKTMLENDAPKAAGGSTGDDPFQLLFATPQNAEEALPAMDSPTRFYRRILKPIFKDENELRSLLLKEENLRVESGVLEFIKDAIDPENGALFKLGSVDADVSAESAFTKQLVEVVRTNVSVDDQFLEREFAFCKVLERNIPHWNARIKQLMGNRTKFADLSEKFGSFLGAEPERDPTTKEYCLPALNELMLSISESMARSCSPWWITDLDPESNHYTVKVFLPEEKEKFGNDDSFSDRLSQSLSFANVEVAWLNEKNAGATPFSVIAFTADSVPELTDTDIANGMHPLDKIRSLDYYRDADVSQWLAWSEDAKGRSIFEQRHNNKGIGYVSPLFVTVPALAAARWRPWDPVKVEDAVARDEALEAIRYGFLGVGLDEADAKTLGGVLGDVAGLPLLRYVKTGQKCQILRRPYQERDGEVVANRRVDWDASPSKPRLLCTSVCNLYPYLQGQGKSGRGGKATDKDIAEGAALRGQILSEKEVFEAKFRKDLGDKFFKKVCEARDEWFQEQWRLADSDDKPVWDKLING